MQRKLVAEALGTGLLVAATVGSGIMADRLTQDGAMALLANMAATAAALFVLITLFSPLSGAQFNPIVTLVVALRREMPMAQAASYIAAQVAGGCLGCLLAHAMFGLPLLQTATTARSGADLWLSEGVAAFGLVLTILGARQAHVAALVAAYIASAYWFTASSSFANPAVTLARSLTNSVAGIQPVDVPAFVVAQCLGALLAAGIGGWLFRAPGKGDPGLAAVHQTETRHVRQDA